MTPNFYRFLLEEVVDGSTYRGWVDLGFDMRVQKRIRLVNIHCHRRLRCPPLASSHSSETDTNKGEPLDQIEDLLSD
jgi:hypothetical protein